MKKIIFWFSNFRVLNYWFEYTRKNFGERLNVKYYKNYGNRNGTITIYDLFEIEFKIDRDRYSHIGIHDINQYWVEELFENNFEEFFYQILGDNSKEIRESKLYKAEHMCVPIETMEESDG